MTAKKMSTLRKMFTLFIYHKFSICFYFFLVVALLLPQATPTEARVYFEEEQAPHNNHNYNRQWHHIPPPLPPKNHKNYMKPCVTIEDCSSPSENLICNNNENRCTCSPTNEYEQFTKKCIEKRPCLVDNTCLDDNSLCYNNVCKCKEGYAHDSDSDSCLKVITLSGRPVVNSFLAQNIFTIVIISNFLLWLSIFVFILQYIKKRRLAVAAIAAHSAAQLDTGSRSRGRAALPPGVPPPPPAYDNIAFDHSSTYPPPPPYSINDTEKTDSDVTHTTSVSVINVPNERLS